MQEDVQKWPVYAQCKICALAPGEEMAQATRALMAMLQADETVWAAASAQTRGMHSLVVCTDARVISLNAQDAGHEVLFDMPVHRIERSMSTIFYGSGSVTVFFDGGQQDFCCMSSHASTPMCKVIDAQHEKRCAQLGLADTVPAVGAQDAHKELQQWPVYAQCEICAVAMQPGEMQATRALEALLHEGETVLAASSALFRGKRALVACTQRRILALSAREENAGALLFTLPMQRAKRALSTIWYGSGNVTVFFDKGQEHFCGMPLHASMPMCRVIAAQHEHAQA